MVINMTPRLTIPDKGNPYYNTIANGGYSKAIVGKPTEDGLNVLRNCVGFAYGRFHEIAGRKQMDLFDPVNAENIYQNAINHGLKVGKTPKPGALIVWQKGATLSGSDGAGHVGVVEVVNADGSIVTSESGYNAAKAFWTGNYKAPYNLNGYTFLGFVYQPETTPQVPTGTIKRGMVGNDVKWLQTQLYNKGYLRKNEIDGDFGTITYGALLAFQVDNKLLGICDTETKQALIK